ncbi:RNA polymerase sigma54 factor [Campylobacter mucosalis]|uniref:RNA polymerase factor sigma-54 n=1 Tax=Campylobacter mucosalis TaxID=202 RepID=UPI0004D3F4FC|nr:RNA polymerase factor sigma-54 [Campylobacter mucosalis]KEA46396.1 RNA polymerase sigma54 factor [Campylobacter mucosalis]QKF63118.1 RNA polymerase sigma54 factor [Campylobacter mucosalis]
MLRVKQANTQKSKLNTTLRSWLGLLSVNLDELKENLENFCEKNPFVTIENRIKVPKKNFFKEISKNSVSDTLEAVVVQKDSLWQTLINQINPPLFPTQKSQTIAKKIIECINDEGYFEYDDEILAGFNSDEVEKIRKRFAYLEPVGVGAKDLKESFLFQLDELYSDDKSYDFAKILIENFDDLAKFTKQKEYENAINLVKKLKNPPAIEFINDSAQVTPDIIINNDENGISVSLNDDFYPEIVLDALDIKSEFVQNRIKEAKDLIDALEMRKATLYKIGLMIVEYQYDFFFGGEIKPMRLKDIADDIARNPSTISRAIANKYLLCSRGTIPLKKFFATAIDDDVSNEAIKQFLVEIINKENPKKPLSDLKIVELIKKEFNIDIVRRTITKYRQMLNIGSSSERKRVYEMKG